MNKFYCLLLSLSLAISSFGQDQNERLNLDLENFPDLDVESIASTSNLNPFVLYTIRDLRQFISGMPFYSTGLAVVDIHYPQHPLLFIHLKNTPGCGPSCAQLSDARVYQTPNGPNMVIHKELAHFNANGDIVADFEGFIFYDDHLEPIDSLAPPALDFHDLAIHPVSGNRVHAEVYQDTLLFPAPLTGFPNDSLFAVEAIQLIETDPQGNIVFSWKSSEHLAPDNMRWSLLNPPGPLIDWDHWNSVRYDVDDNLLVSFRHIGLVKVFRPDATYPNGRHLIFSGNNSDFNLPEEHQTYLQHDFYYYPEDGYYHCYANGTMQAAVGDPKIPATGFTFDINWQDTSYTLVNKYRPMDSLTSFGGGNWHQNADGSHIFNLGGFINIPAGNPLASQPVAFYADENDEVHYQFYFNEGGIFSYQFHSFDITQFQFERPEITCSPASDGIVLSTTQSYDRYYWSTGDTTATITVQDRDTFFVRVALNEFFASSSLPEFFDPDDQCTITRVTDETAKENSVTVVPNPSNEVFNLSVEHPQECNLFIFNSLGKSVFERKNLFLSSSNYTIPFEDQDSGMYLMLIQNVDSGEVQQEKLLFIK